MVADLRCSRRHIVIAVALLAVSFVGLLFAESPAWGADAARPNVIVLLTDDQGYGDLSCHGNPVLKTPNLDRLHSQSIRLVDFHSAPMCTPTRGQLLTGMDALRNGATSVTAGRSFIRPGIPTLPEVLAAQGYRTGIFGKWHLGDNYPHRPHDRGFMEAVYHQGWGFTSAPEFANTLIDGRYFRRGEEQNFKGYCTDVWFQEAMHWMKAQKDSGQPFFCYLPTNAPHSPHVVPEQYSKPYEGRGPAAFFGMIANIDENLGKLEQFLQDEKLRDNTILIYMTDNGGTAGVKLFNAGMRGSKTMYYEGGHRVPCFVRWPAGNLRSAGDVTQPAQMQDIFPTLLELCGLKTPSECQFDGRSLSGLLRGNASENNKLPERMLVVQYGQILAKWDCCVIWDRWRLVKRDELYNLANDPGQQENVAARYPDVLARLRAHYESWWSELEPRLNDFVPTSLGGSQNPVPLTSSDWEGVYADNSRHIGDAAGGPRGGPWNVLVEQAGDYEISLRRWPRETRLALGAKANPQSKALPVTGGIVTAAGQKWSVQGNPEDQELHLQVTLPKGRTQLQAWFQDAQGQDLTGAFYAYVRRK